MKVERGAMALEDVGPGGDQSTRLLATRGAVVAAVDVAVTAGLTDGRIAPPRP